MLKRQICYRIFCIAVIISVITFSGCKEPTSNSGAPKLTASPKPVEDNDAKTKAVQLYVDAMMLRDLQRWDNAIMKLNNAIEISPDFSLAYSFKGDIHQLNKQYKISADSYEKATKIDPWSFQNFANLGKVSQIIKDYQRAVKAYVSACELKTDDFEVHLGAGRCYYELEDYELAFDYGQRAKEIKADKGQADVLIGDIYSARSETFSANQQVNQAKSVLVDATTAYKRALEAEGNKPQIMVALAVTHTKYALLLQNEKERKANFSFAEELLNSALKKEPHNTKAYNTLGSVQLYLHNNLDAAFDCYTKAAGIEEKNWTTQKGLGVVYMLKYMDAREIAIEQKTLAKLDDALKQKAFKCWDVSLALNPDQPELRNIYGGFKGE